MQAIRTILCPTDFSSTSDRSRHLAGELAQSFNARLVLHHNLADSPPGFLSVGWMKNEEEADRTRDLEVKASEGLAHLLDSQPEGVEAEARLTRGPLEDGIRSLAEQIGADLIVLGSHGHSTVKHQSLTELLLRDTGIPILATGGHCERDSLTDAPPTAPIVVAVDLDQPVAGFADGIIELASRLPNPLAWLYVDPLSRESSSERLIEKLPTDLADRSTVMIRHGDPAKAILEAAKELDSVLIVVGTGQQRWFERRIGRTAVAVLQESGCPTLCIPPVRRRRAADQPATVR